jgi:hypothetical protein
MMHFVSILGEENRMGEIPRPLANYGCLTFHDRGCGLSSRCTLGVLLHLEDWTG